MSEQAGAKKYEVSPAETVAAATATATSAGEESKKSDSERGLLEGSAKPNLVQKDSVFMGVMSERNNSESADDGLTTTPKHGRGGVGSGLTSRPSLRRRFTAVARSGRSNASKVLQSSLLPEDVQLAQSTRGRGKQKKFFRKLLNSEAVGSRSVGGEAPQDVDEYALAQSNDYLIPDTVAHAQVVRSTTPRQRQLRLVFFGMGSRGEGGERGGGGYLVFVCDSLLLTDTHPLSERAAATLSGSSTL